MLKLTIANNLILAALALAWPFTIIGGQTQSLAETSHIMPTFQCVDKVLREGNNIQLLNAKQNLQQNVHFQAFKVCPRYAQIYLCLVNDARHFVPQKYVKNESLSDMNMTSAFAYSKNYYKIANRADYFCHMYSRLEESLEQAYKLRVQSNVSPEEAYNEMLADQEDSYEDHCAARTLQDCRDTLTATFNAGAKWLVGARMRKTEEYVPGGMEETFRKEWLARLEKKVVGEVAQDMMKGIEQELGLAE